MTLVLENYLTGLNVCSQDFSPRKLLNRTKVRTTNLKTITK